MKAFVVAANNYDRERYKRILQDLELEVHDTVRSGIDAIRVFRVLKPDLVIIDFLIPEMSGLDVLRTMKNEYDSAAVVLLTPVDTRAIIERAFRLRADDVLVKPFSDQEFASTVLHVIHNLDTRSQFLTIS